MILQVVLQSDRRSIPVRNTAFDHPTKQFKQSSSDHVVVAGQ